MSLDEQADAIERSAESATELSHRGLTGGGNWSTASALTLAPDEIWVLATVEPVIGFLFNNLFPEQSEIACTVVRDVFGDAPVLPEIDANWRTADVVALARGIYEDRAFDRLPILADALMDAGCSDESILNHCRTKGPHVRGCWVVDLVLGKA
jgi:hypothetical protein